ALVIAAGGDEHAIAADGPRRPVGALVDNRGPGAPPPLDDPARLVLVAPVVPDPVQVRDPAPAGGGVPRDRPSRLVDSRGTGGEGEEQGKQSQWYEALHGTSSRAGDGPAGRAYPF